MSTLRGGWGPRTSESKAWRKFYTEEINRVRRALGENGTSIRQKLRAGGRDVGKHTISRMLSGKGAVSFEVILTTHQLLVDSLVSRQELLLRERQTAADVMTKALVWLKADEQLASAVKKLNRLKLSQAPVKDRRGRVIGVLVRERLLPSRGFFSHSRHVGDYVQEVNKVHPGTSLRTVQKMLLERDGYVLVETRGEVVGIVTWYDILSKTQV